MYAVEITYDRDRYGHRSRCFRDIQEPEQAAQIFESEAEPPKPELGELVERLALGEKLEDFNDETGKTVVAYELVGAVV
ncbi:MAG TPA: hypothetical protein VI039_13005 [Solirubrobacterales bacterium]